MIVREKYLEIIKQYKNTEIIKVITGIRRSGKSVLLNQFRDSLIADGVLKSRLIHINFESLQYNEIVNYQDLYSYIENRISPNGKTFLLLDEVQKVQRWEKALASFQVDFNCDIYITGSNAYLLSSELSTLLSGRYVEIHVLPLSFQEFSTLNNGLSIREKFDSYVKYGGFPGLLELQEEEHIRQGYLEGVFNTVVVKDIIARAKVSDVDLLNRIVGYMLENIGNLTSANKISDYLTSNNRSTPPSTVIDYLSAFEKAFVLYRARRYRVRGKQILRSPDKFYVVDTGLRNMNQGFSIVDIGRVLENIVYLELIRRGLHVYVGVDSKHEIDFVTIKGDKKTYYQVSLSIADDSVREREVKGLLSIKDNHPKILLTMDYSGDQLLEGIIHKNIVDFLLE